MAHLQYDVIPPHNLRARKTIFQTPAHKRIYDSAIPSIQGIRDIIPKVKGLADVRMRNAANKISNVVDAIELAGNTARDPSSPDQDFARDLFSDPRFLRLLSSELEQISSLVTQYCSEQKPAVNQDLTSPADPRPDLEGKLPSMAREGGGAKPEENFDPQDTTTKMNGADGMPPTAPNSFTVKHLERALEVRNFAPHYHLSKNPKIGLDAARKAVSELQFVPAWDSNVWQEETRRDYRARAITNGEIARHLAQFGVEPMDSKGKTLPIPVWNMPDGPIRRYFENE
jgi:hypothetical protein